MKRDGIKKMTIWNGDTSVVMSKAINGITKSDGNVGSPSGGVVEL